MKSLSHLVYVQMAHLDVDVDVVSVHWFKEGVCVPWTLTLCLINYFRWTWAVR